MSSAATRAICFHCLRPARACICGWATSTVNRLEVLLQHPLETGHAKNSLNLLRLSLALRTVAVGEVFAPDELQRLLYGTGPGGRAPGSVQPVLLYPARQRLRPTLTARRHAWWCWTRPGARAARCSR